MSESNVFERMAAVLLKRWPQGKWVAYINEPSTGLSGHDESGVVGAVARCEAAVKAAFGEAA